jgi:hypothetical protein
MIPTRSSHIRVDIPSALPVKRLNFLVASPCQATPARLQVHQSTGIVLRTRMTRHCIKWIFNGRPYGHLFCALLPFDTVCCTRIRALQSHKFLNKPSCRYLMRMNDRVPIFGPNGVHSCLVLDILGPSVVDVEEHFCGKRLQTDLAKRIARRILRELSFLHEHGIGHGGHLQLYKSHDTELILVRHTRAQCSFH